MSPHTPHPNWGGLVSRFVAMSFVNRFLLSNEFLVKLVWKLSAIMSPFQKFASFGSGRYITFLPDTCNAVSLVVATRCPDH